MPFNKKQSAAKTPQKEDWPDLPPAQPLGFAAHPVDYGCSEAVEKKPINSLILLHLYQQCFTELTVAQTGKEQAP